MNELDPLIEKVNWWVSLSPKWTSYDEWEGEAVSDRFFDEGSINENNDEPVIQGDSSWCWCST